MSSISNILTIDVEEWFQVYNLWDSIPRSTWDSYPSRLESQINRLLTILARHECKATFFVLGWVAKHRPNVVKAIVREGHEIASHGLNHDLVFDMDAERFREETLETNRILEDLAGSKIRGYRASNFSITRENLCAFEVLAELGFEYDSSVYPINRRRYGIPGFPRGPVRLELPSGNSLVEFPAPTMSLFGIPIPVAGGGFFRFWHYSITSRAIKSLNRKGLPAVIYLHPWELDPDQPRIKGGGRHKLWMHYYNLDKTYGRLERILTEFKFEKMRELMRQQADVLPNYKLEGGSWNYG